LIAYATLDGDKTPAAKTIDLIMTSFVNAFSLDRKIRMKFLAMHPLSDIVGAQMQYVRQHN